MLATLCALKHRGAGTSEGQQAPEILEHQLKSPVRLLNGNGPHAENVSANFELDSRRPRSEAVAHPLRWSCDRAADGGRCISGLAVLRLADFQRVGAISWPIRCARRINAVRGELRNVRHAPDCQQYYGGCDASVRRSRGRLLARCANSIDGFGQNGNGSRHSSSGRDVA